LKDLADIHLPRAKTIVLIQDKLKFTAKRRSMRLSRPPKGDGWLSASNGTPKHGSLLDLAEIPTRRSAALTPFRWTTRANR
jgi:hypothetical protein